jgi:hypothetical protein
MKSSIFREITPCGPFQGNMWPPFYQLHADFFPRLFFDREDGDGFFLRNRLYGVISQK